MSLPYSSSSPADSKEKADECVAAGEAMKVLLAKDIKPRDIMTKAAFENSIRMVMMTGGSTNAVLHLIAMSRSCQDPDVCITLDDFQRISDIVSNNRFPGRYLHHFVPFSHSIVSHPSCCHQRLPSWRT